MKTRKNSILLFTLIIILQGFFLAMDLNAQEKEEQPKTWVVVKNDGSRYVGKIIEQDAREVLLESLEIGLVYIPRHEIKEIRGVEQSEISSTGKYMPSEIFSTRYFLTTNGLPIKKGESYIIWGLLGPDIQFGVGDNISLGILTSWLASPLIGSAKRSIPINKKWSAGAGILLGTGLWLIPDFRLALPYGVISNGDRVKNISFSFGYGWISSKVDNKRVSEGNFLLSVAGMAKAGRTLSLVFDSFIVPRTGTYQDTEYYSYFDPISGNTLEATRPVTKKRHSVIVLAPGIRLQTNPRGAFQFGFAGISFDGRFQSFPFPMLQWFRML